jgi:hypothetical protein
VKPVIVLGCKAEDAQRPSYVAFGIFGIGVPKKALQGEFSSLDPDGLGRLDVVEDNRAAIGGRDNNPRIIRRRDWTSPRFQGAIEELIESLELVERKQNFRHVKLVESDECRYFSSRGGIIILPPLLEA